jgi:phosphoribosyl 1,2-cyclic phosphodiesterase
MRDKIREAEMKVTFYGTRGSIPVPDPDFVQVGGNTPCILFTSDNGRIAIFDAGTGIRKLGNDLLARSHEQYDNIFIALSHTHWDHIQGFPFFLPAYDPDRHFTIAIGGRNRQTRNLEDIFSTQMQREYFPVPVEKMGARMSFFVPDTTHYTTTTPITGNKVVTLRHNHPGGAYSYRVEGEGKIFVYCTDVEHVDGIDPDIVAIARDADLLVHDAQYTPEELKEKKGWGHSSWEQAVEVAEQAGVKRLALFHHDPEHTDSFLFRMEEECQRRFAGAFLSREGMEIEI